ncbi:MAG: aminodeoxychorismate/anthranilate synthase component II [Methanomicrobium sp.]|nr:aminodeoxychorismate/anthranilate synthase component II [Methanomicrobium sp.]
MKVLIIDCYDSFTYNLCQQIGSLGAECEVIKYDSLKDSSYISQFDRIVLSPGPGKPEDTKLCLKVLKDFHRKIPILGVCLGHQAICHFFGGDVVCTGKPVHGMTSEINHNCSGIFSGIKNSFTATRYHSLAVDENTLPDCLTVTARSADDKMIMAVSHSSYPVFGLQFHPESIMTKNGDKIIRNFLSQGVVQ